MSAESKRISLVELRAKSDARRKQLTENLGLACPDELTGALHSKTDHEQIRHDKTEIENRSHEKAVVEKKRKKEQTEHDDEYTDSSTFLKGDKYDSWKNVRYKGHRPL